MIPYLFLILIIMVQGILFMRKSNTRMTNIFFFLVWLELTLIGGFRSVNVARDTHVYYSAFNYVSHMPDFYHVAKHMELGFLYFMKFLSFLYDSPQFLFLVVAGFYVYVFFRVIRKWSPWPFVSVLVFVSAVPFGSYVFGISFLRQAVAIGCFLLGLEQLIKGKKFLFILWILFGLLFHKSVIICLVLLLLYKIQIDLKTLILTFVGVCVFMVVFPALLPHLPFGIGRYAGYMSWEIGETSPLTALLKAMGQLSVTLTLVYIYLSRQDTSPLTKCFVWISVLAFVCEFSAIRVLFMNRILYFTVCNCILIPYALSHIRRQKEFMLFLFGFGLLFIFNNTEFWMRRAYRENLDQYETCFENPYALKRWKIDVD